ncbi:adenylate kinase [Streptomyces sp. NPDC001156]
MRIVLIGPPGAGKGTQARFIASKLRIPSMSTGDIFRSHVGRGTSLGRDAKRFMDAGELVPDEITIDMLRERLAERDATNGFLLDGFPRNAAQAQILDEMLAEAGTGLNVVLELTAAEAEIVRRLSGRRQCRAHGHVTHTDLLRDADLCNLCGSRLYQRDDDREEVVRHRLEIYRAQTYPLVGHYTQRNLLVTVRAEGPFDEVTDRAMAALRVLDE